MGNENLHQALKNKNDEFYTFYEDIEKECNNYISFFENKKIYLICDDDESNFWKYFLKQFNKFKLKSLTATSLSFPKGKYFCTEDGKNIIFQNLVENGDFQTAEIQKILKEQDIIITNPPFSLFRKLVILLEQYNKQYLLIGNENTLASTEIFPLFKDEKITIGYNKVKTFFTPNKEIKTFGNITWFTNLPIQKIVKPLRLTKKYDENIYKKYDNFEAINVDKVAEIPLDYNGIMGVPITYLNKHNDQQFKILGLAAGNTKNNNLNFEVKYTPSPLDRGGCGVINGVRKYSRVFIQKRKENQ